MWWHGLSRELDTVPGAKRPQRCKLHGLSELDKFTSMLPARLTEFFLTVWEVYLPASPAPAGSPGLCCGPQGIEKTLLTGLWKASLPASTTFSATPGGKKLPVGVERSLAGSGNAPGLVS